MRRGGRCDGLLGAQQWIGGISAPAQTASRPSAPVGTVYQAFAQRVEVEETQHRVTFSRRERVRPADKFVVLLAGVEKGDRATHKRLSARSASEPRPEHHHIEGIAVGRWTGRHTAVVERAGQGREEFNGALRIAFYETATWDFDQDLDGGSFDGHG